MDYCNDLEIGVFHLKRGGGHAVINWLAQTSRRQVFYLNAIFGKPLKVRLRGRRVFRRFTDDRGSEKDPKGILYRVELPPEATYRDVAVMPKEVLMYNMENFALERVPRESLFTGGAERIVGRSRERRTVLILRDAFNTFASVARGKRRMRRRLDTFYAGQWKNYAREFLGETRYLPQDTIKIDYNRWFVDDEYRQQIAAAFGFDYVRDGLDEVTAFGGGSSFSGQQVSGRALGVLERWRDLVDEPAYRAAFDNETIELSNRIFGDVTGGALRRS